MNQIVKHSFCMAALLSSCMACATVVPYLSFRTQGLNGAREIVGWQTQINKFDMCKVYGSFSITPEYTRSFRPCDISQFLFSDALVASNCSNNCNTNCNDNGSANCNNNCCNTSSLLVEGTVAKNNTGQTKALMAENFYLPSDFQSTVSFKPVIDNFIVDFNLFLGLDEWCEGLFFRIHTPLVHTRWNLNMCEKVVNAGVNPYDLGYMDSTSQDLGALPDYGQQWAGMPRSDMLEDFTSFVSKGESIATIDGTIYQPLHNARMSTCWLKKTALAEITAALGWNFLLCQDYRLGLLVRAAAPTGNRPEGVWLFEPIVGQGKHWELGGGLTSQWRWWCSEDEERDFTVYLDAWATHLFKTRQCRTFDLCGKPLSRYMLAEKFTSSVADLGAGTDEAALNQPAYQFANELVPVANFSTIPVDVSAAVQGEIILKFAYTHCNFQFDLGYNFWGRSCEKICKRCDCTQSGAFPANTYGLKGDSFIYGFTLDDSEAPSLVVPLSATQSKATIFGGTNNFGKQTNGLLWHQNPGVDNPQPSWYGTATDATVLVTTEIGAGYLRPEDQVNTSYNPVLLSEDDLDIKGAQTRGLSHKIFTHFNYTWNDCECYVPYLGIGGEVEFAQRDCNNGNSTCNTNCNSTCNTSCASNCSTSCDNTNCKNATLSQWGVWVKGGFSFN